MADDAHRAIDAVWRIESARLIAGITRIVRDVGIAEEIAQDERGQEHGRKDDSAYRGDFLGEEIQNSRSQQDHEYGAQPDRHLDELAAVAATGARAVLLYIIQIPSAERFAVARDIDPAYASAFDRARVSGVETLAWRCAVTVEGIEIAAPVPIVAA